MAAADVFLEYDPLRLQVEGVVAGSELALLGHGIDNMGGHVSLVASNGGPTVQGSFILATLHLRAWNCSGVTAVGVSFGLAGAWQSVVRDQNGTDVLGEVHNAVITLSEPSVTPTATATRLPSWLYLPIVVS